VELGVAATELDAACVDAGDPKRSGGGGTVYEKVGGGDMA
jgi:hypothetical protein